MIKYNYILFLLLLLFSCINSKLINLQLIDCNDPEHDIFLNSLINTFNEENENINITIKRCSIKRLFKEIKRNKLKANIIRIPSEYLEILIKNKSIKNFNNIFDEDFYNLFINEALSSSTIDNAVCGIPDNFGSHLVLYYNKYYIGKKIEDINEMIKWGKWRTDKSKNKYGLVFPLKNPFYIYPWFRAFKGDITNDNIPNINSKEIIDAFQFIYDLKFKYKIVPDDCNAKLAEKLFLEKNASMIINGDWAFEKYSDIFGHRLGIVPLPISSETKQYPSSFSSTKCFAINKKLKWKKLEAAKIFIKFMTSEKTQKKWVAQGKLPSLKSLEKEDLIIDNPHLRGLWQGLLKSKGKFKQSKMKVLNKALKPYLEKLVDGSISAESTAKQTQEYLEMLWRKNNLYEKK